MHSVNQLIYTLAKKGFTMKKLLVFLRRNILNGLFIIAFAFLFLQNQNLKKQIYSKLVEIGEQIDYIERGLHFHGHDEFELIDDLEDRVSKIEDELHWYW